MGINVNESYFSASMDRFLQLTQYCYCRIVAVEVHRSNWCYTAVRARMAFLQHRYVQISVHDVDPVSTTGMGEQVEAGHVS